MNGSEKVVRRPESRFELDRMTQSPGRLLVRPREIEPDAQLHVDHRGERLESLRLPKFHQPLLKFSSKTQVHPVPLVRDGVIRVERKGLFELELRDVAINIEEHADDSQADVRFRDIPVYS